MQAQARELYRTLTEKTNNRRTPVGELAAAYGQVGMLLHAAEYHDAAEPCYADAQTLAPGEIRWPYYLGHLYKSTGDTTKAEAAFRRVLEVHPEDFPALVWLGRLYLDEGRPTEAEAAFKSALALEPRAVAALAGLGRVAAARRDYALAARQFEDALAIDPEAESLHAPLAAAYRALGEPHKAAPHARQWGNRDILLPDALRQELDLLLESGLSYELRGIRALEGRDWPAAAAFFRKGLALTPANTPLRRSLQHKLGTALYMTGDIAGAEQQFAQVVQLAPPAGIDESVAKAHYSLGVLIASKTGSPEAIDHFSAAVKYQPTYFEAELALADLLRRAGRVEPALAHYKEALAINPRLAPARLGYALALTSLGRFRDARDWLLEASERYRDHPEFAHALARLFATAPDDRVRDGQRAMSLVEELLKGQKTTDLGETMAMALAEVGEYDRAAAVQRGVLEAAQHAGLDAAMKRMSDNLKLYERRRPCRTPWRTDEVTVLPSNRSLTPDLSSSR